MIIVVGIDGSPEARNALRWAAREARAHGADLWLVNAWSFPFAAPELIAQPVLEADVIEDVRGAAAELLERELEQVQDDAVGLDVGRLVVEGAPVDVLLATARDADMLVLGRQAAPTEPDSTVQQCVHRAPCPVVVVP